MFSKYSFFLFSLTTAKKSVKNNAVLDLFKDMAGDTQLAVEENFRKESHWCG